MPFTELKLCVFLVKFEIEYLPKYLGKFSEEIVKPLDEGDDGLQNFNNGDTCIVFKASDFYRWFNSYSDTVNDILESNISLKKNK